MAPARKRPAPPTKNQDQSGSNSISNSSENPANVSARTKNQDQSGTNSSSNSSRNPANARKKPRSVVVVINNKEVKFNMKLLVAIRKLQQGTQDLIPKASFCRLVREVTQDQGRGEFRWNVNALNALQVSAEMYLTQLFEDSNKCAGHAKRVTIKPPDMNLVMDLCSKYEPNMKR